MSNERRKRNKNYELLAMKEKFYTLVMEFIKHLILCYMRYVEKSNENDEKKILLVSAR